jgi:hypothetical protein
VAQRKQQKRARGRLVRAVDVGTSVARLHLCLPLLFSPVLVLRGYGIYD